MRLPPVPDGRTVDAHVNLLYTLTTAPPQVFQQRQESSTCIGGLAAPVTRPCKASTAEAPALPRGPPTPPAGLPCPTHALARPLLCAAPRVALRGTRLQC